MTTTTLAALHEGDTFRWPATGHVLRVESIWEDSAGRGLHAVCADTCNHPPGGGWDTFATSPIWQEGLFGGRFAIGARKVELIHRP